MASLVRCRFLVGQNLPDSTASCGEGAKLRGAYFFVNDASLPLNMLLALSRSHGHTQGESGSPHVVCWCACECDSLTPLNALHETFPLRAVRVCVCVRFVLSEV